jgi:3-O-acyltransferase
MPELAARSTRLPGLTGWRFFLALTVVLVHLTSSSQLFADDGVQLAFGTLSILASAALASFFCLSGFVLVWSAPAADTAPRFWRRRFWKIVPLHVLAWVAAVVFIAGTTAPSPVLGANHDLRAGPAVANLLLVQNWVPSWDYLSYLNVPAWSISCEAFFYLCFPLLLPIIARIPAERLRRWVLGVVAVSVLIPGLSLLLTGPRLFDWLPFNITQYWLVYTFPPVRLLNFVLGMLLARLVQTGRWKPLRRRVILPATIVAFLASPLVPLPFIFSAVLFTPLLLAIPDLAHGDTSPRTDGRPRRGVLRRPTFVALGNASYALYIIHFPILLAVRQALGVDRRFTPGAGLLIALGLLAVSVAVSLGLHRWFEEPVRRRCARPRQAAAISTVPAQRWDAGTAPGDPDPLPSALNRP